MRLLDTDKLEVVLIKEDAIPPYAILSHTWGGAEVSLQEMHGLSGKDIPSNIPSLEKVIAAAKLAASDGYRWIWVDTCCIDKNSSAELSEAINSMYRWYENAGVCYVYLQDDPDGQREAGPSSEEQSNIWTLQNSRWATRGWTLQELIAPNVVRFYNKDWDFMGEKSDPLICETLTRATGIGTGVLSGWVTVAEVSVASRMKWASRRRTTRPEDVAYCLMGLFGVNMPLLYGEGGVRAFIRLQEQILKAMDDQSIFAWQLHSEDNDDNMYGLLATEPSYFENIPSIYLMSVGIQSSSSVPWSMSNKGFNVQLYIRPAPDDTAGKSYLAILDCFQDHGMSDHNTNDESQTFRPAIYLRRLYGDEFTRIRAHVCESIGERARDGGRRETLFVKQNSAPPLPSLGLHNYLRCGQSSHSWRLEGVCPSHLWDGEAGIFQLSLSRARSIQGVFRLTRSQHNRNPSTHFEFMDENLDVAVVLQRTSKADLEPVCFLRRVEGTSVKLAYHLLNNIWIKSTKDQDRLLDTPLNLLFRPEIIKTVKDGRRLYLLNFRWKVS